MSLKTYLKTVRDRVASDLFLTAGAKPSIKVQGHMETITETPLTGEQVKKIAYEIMKDEEKIKEFETELEMNLAIADDELGRFRVNIYQQSTEVGIVIRSITTEIPSVEELNLPPILNELVLAKRGLILVVGATSSGKSTSLAAMIGYRNKSLDGHIVTIEDPIEYVHQHQKSLISQREVGLDTLSYANALKNTLRQAPDVILIGEIRDNKTMGYGIAFSETGHLCLSTLHANNANQALDRIINFFPRPDREGILHDLSLNLVAIMSQRLIPTLDKKRVPAVEILIGTPMIRELIRRGDISAVKDLMEKSTAQGMQTFDQALFTLYTNKKISQEEALKNADSANNLRLRISLSEGTSGDGADKFSLLDDDDGAEDDDGEGGFFKPKE